MQPELKKTKNYDLFDLYEVNRRVKQEKIGFKRILTLMAREGFIPANPLHCVKGKNGKLQIKAGHHRLAAAQILDIPVWYVVTNDKATVIELEQAGVGKWSTDDFLTSYCKQGNLDYLEIKKYVERTGISINHAASMFYGQSAGSGNFLKDKEGKFATGKFKIRDREHAHIVGEIVLHLKACGANWANQSSSVNAISKIVRVPQFDPKRFMKKAKVNSFILSKQRNVQEYLAHFEEVYNYKTTVGKRLNIAFLAQEIADQRKLRFGKTA